MLLAEEEKRDREGNRLGAGVGHGEGGRGSFSVICEESCTVLTFFFWAFIYIHSPHYLSCHLSRYQICLSFYHTWSTMLPKPYMSVVLSGSTVNQHETTCLQYDCMVDLFFRFLPGHD